MAWLASSKARKCRRMAVSWPGLGWEEVVDEEWAFQRGSVPREWGQGQPRWETAPPAAALAVACRPCGCRLPWGGGCRAMIVES